MSPSESDLRAALRDGEGDDRPDIDEVLARARGARTQRRVRLLSAAAAVVVVAGAAVGGAVLWGGSDGDGQQAVRSGPADPGATAVSPSGGPSSAGPSSAGPSSAAGPGTAAACPTSAPRLIDPPGSLPTTAPQQPMFAAPVATVLVCAYTETGTVTGVTAAPLVLTGTKAAALADSIERASATKLQIVCPDIASAESKQLAIIGITAGGTQLPTVSTDVSIPNCNQPITNGTAVRWAWKPPASLSSLISALTTRLPRVQPSVGASGVNGSPAR